MNTNVFFSPSRFYRLLCNDLLLNHKRYLFTLAGATIALYIILLYNMTNAYQKYDANNYLMVFMLGIAGVGAFIGTSFPELSDKIRTCNYLLQPGSIFEKFLVQFLIRFIVCLSLFFLIYWIDVHIARFTALRMDSVQKKGIIINSFNFKMLLGEITHTGDKIALVFGLFSIATFLFSVRLFFSKFALVKTVILGATLVCVFICGMVVLSHIFYPETTGFNINITIYKVTSNLLSSTLLFYYLAGFSWLLLLPMGYFKLKEKEE